MERRLRTMTTANLTVGLILTPTIGAKTKMANQPEESNDLSSPAKKYRHLLVLKGRYHKTQTHIGHPFVRRSSLTTVFLAGVPGVHIPAPSSRGFLRCQDCPFSIRDRSLIRFSSSII